MSDGMELPIGFDIRSANPIDKRTVQATLEFAKQIPATLRYEGLPFYDKETKMNYQFVGGVADADLQPFPAAGGAGSPMFQHIFSITHKTLNREIHGSYLSASGEQGGLTGLISWLKTNNIKGHYPALSVSGVMTGGASENLSFILGGMHAHPTNNTLNVFYNATATGINYTETIDPTESLWDFSEVVIRGSSGAAGEPIYLHCVSIYFPSINSIIVSYLSTSDTADGLVGLSEWLRDNDFEDGGLHVYPAVGMLDGGGDRPFGIRAYGTNQLTYSLQIAAGGQTSRLVPGTATCNENIIPIAFGGSSGVLSPAQLDEVVQQVEETVFEKIEPEIGVDIEPEIALALEQFAGTNVGIPYTDECPMFFEDRFGAIYKKLMNTSLYSFSYLAASLAPFDVLLWQNDHSRPFMPTSGALTSNPKDDAVVLFTIMPTQVSTLEEYLLDGSDPRVTYRNPAHLQNGFIFVPDDHFLCFGAPMVYPAQPTFTGLRFMNNSYPDYGKNSMLGMGMGDNYLMSGSGISTYFFEIKTIDGVRLAQGDFNNPAMQDLLTRVRHLENNPPEPHEVLDDGTTNMRTFGKWVDAAPLLQRSPMQSPTANSSAGTITSIRMPGNRTHYSVGRTGNAALTVDFPLYDINHYGGSGIALMLRLSVPSGSQVVTAAIGRANDGYNDSHADHASRGVMRTFAAAYARTTLAYALHPKNTFRNIGTITADPFTNVEIDIIAGADANQWWRGSFKLNLTSNRWNVESYQPAERTSI